MKKGYCDPRCWNAKGKICRCWCCGANHGIGLQEDNAMGALMLVPEVKKYGILERHFEMYLESPTDETIESIIRELKIAYKVQ